MTATAISFEAALERKQPGLPVYIVVPADHAQALGLRATAVVEGEVNGHDIGRRSIKRWENIERSPWFVEFTTPFCRKAGVAVGDPLSVSLRLASSALPEELERLLAHSPRLKAVWNSLSEYARRSSAEHVRAGKSAATRSRRAAVVASRLAESEAPSRPYA